MVNLTQDTLLTGRRILVCEDEALICMLLEDFIEEVGGMVIGPYSNIREALPVAEKGAFDLAILDIHLADGSVYPVAEVLEARKVPFLLMTGYDTDARFDSRGWPLFGKPFHGEQLVARLVELFVAHQTA